jgi:hypothetical protein
MSSNEEPSGVLIDELDNATPCAETKDGIVINRRRKNWLYVLMIAKFESKVIPSAAIYSPI